MNDPEHKEDALTLEILETIEKDSGVTQRHLATNLGVALGLANSYLKRCARKGLIKIHQAPANRYLYYLTPKGFTEKSRLTAKYLSSSFEFYRRASDSCKAVLDHCHKKGWHRVVLCGYSELAEIALLRAQEHGQASDIEVIGIFDPEQSGKSRLGMPVWTQLEQIPANDALILTAFKQPELLLESLTNSVEDQSRVLVPSILGLNRKKYL